MEHITLITKSLKDTEVCSTNIGHTVHVAERINSKKTQRGRIQQHPAVGNEGAKGGVPSRLAGLLGGKGKLALFRGCATKNNPACG